VNSLPKTVIRQRRDCDLNLGPSAPESSTLTTRLPSHPSYIIYWQLVLVMLFQGVSQTKPTFDSPFRRNAAFSKPVSERWDPENVKPYEHDHVPNM